MAQDWSIKPITRPLNAEEIHFLRTHTPSDIGFYDHVEEMDPILKFSLDVLKSTFCQIALTKVIEAGSELVDYLGEKIEQLKHEEQADASDHKRALEEAYLEDLRANRRLASTGGDEADHALKFSKKFGKVLGKEAMKAKFSEYLKQIYDAKVLESIGEGKTIQQAQKIAETFSKDFETFVKRVGKSAKYGAILGKCATSYHETGNATEATAECLASLGKNLIESGATKYLVAPAMAALGCSNPATLGALIVMGIADTLTPTPIGMDPPPAPNLSPAQIERIERIQEKLRGLPHSSVPRLEAPKTYPYYSQGAI